MSRYIPPEEMSEAQIREQLDAEYELDRTTLNSLAPRAAVLMRKYIDNDDSWTYHRDYAISEAVSEYKEDKDNG